MIKKLMITALMLCGAMTVAAGGRWEKSLGPKLGYASQNSSCVVGLAFQCAVSSNLRIAPEIGCVFRNKNQDALLIDLNVHAPFSFGTSTAELYPLAGIAYNSWSTHGLKDANSNDVTTHTNRLGVNVGAGFGLRCSPTLKLSIEAKYTIVKSLSSTYVTAGISYIF